MENIVLIDYIYKKISEVEKETLVLMQQFEDSENEDIVTEIERNIGRKSAYKEILHLLQQE